MIQQMLAIWSLVPLPFLKPAWASGSSRFTYCWSLVWRILSINLLVCEMSAFFGIAFLWDWNENGPFSVRLSQVSFLWSSKILSLNPFLEHPVWCCIWMGTHFFVLVRAVKIFFLMNTAGYLLLTFLSSSPLLPLSTQKSLFEIKIW